MRRLPVFMALAVSSILVLSGCKKQPQEDPRLRELEAENAALRAQLLAEQQQQQQQKKKAQPASPKPRPALSEATRRKLEGSGIKVKESGDSVTLTLPNKILFASGSASLRRSARRALDQSAAVINSDLADANIIVVGHTDNQPIRRTKHLWKTNYQLSVARAKAVAAHLQKSGVGASRISVKGMGEAKPVASNKTSKGRALNRRVEIVVSVTP